MRFGVVSHKRTKNIGDDIQTFAAVSLLPKVDYVIDRESLDDFKSDDGGPVATVMSAWYMWKKWNWPPSKYILPLFTGFHYTDNELAQQDGSPVKTEFLHDLGKEYMNRFGPIGCRDDFTLNTLKGIGIESYFSGCITLTLPKMPLTEDNKKYVCCVDISKSAVERTKTLLDGTGIEVRVIKHRVDYSSSPGTWEERQKAVAELLTVYQNALCVITRRLHCILPCLAMETPVLALVTRTPNIEMRFEPYLQWINYCSDDMYASGQYEYDVANPPRNSKEYLPYREKLIKTVTDFAEKYKDDQSTLSDTEKSDPYYNTETLIRWRHDTMKSCMNDWLYVTREHIHRIRGYKSQTNKLEKKISNLESISQNQEKEIEKQKKEIAALKETNKKQKTETENQKAAIEQQKNTIEKQKKEISDLRETNKKQKDETDKISETLKQKSKRLSHLEKIVRLRSVKKIILLRNFLKPKNKIEINEPDDDT